MANLGKHPAVEGLRRDSSYSLSIKTCLYGFTRGFFSVSSGIDDSRECFLGKLVHV
jgi:hypothetical protein